MLLPFLLLFLTVSVHSTDRICTDNFQQLNAQKCVRFNAKTPYSTHAVAVRQCGFFGGYPIVIQNAIDNNYIAKLAASSSSSQFVWIGLTCFGNSPSQCFWDDASGNSSSFSQFAPGYPDTSQGECVTMATSGSTAGKWYSSKCNILNDYVCQMPPTYPDSTCDYLFSDFCYYIPSQDASLLSTVDAELDCQLRGMHLTSIHSASEFEYLRRSISNTEIIIGARQTSDDTFEWLDGTQWDYQRPILRDGRDGDGGCVYLNGWNEARYDNMQTIPCSKARYRYICKKAAGSQGVGIPKTTTSFSGCNATYITAPGVITSPNYPQLYPSNTLCNYLIRSTDGLRIGILFTDVMTQSGDVIQLFDGVDSNSELITTISGEKRNELFYSTANSLFVTFQSSSGKVAFGFRAELETYTI